MPHLSPMNWLTSILLLWIFLLIMSSGMFFQYPGKFLSPKYPSSSLSKMPWNWLLQDGRD